MTSETCGFWGLEAEKMVENLEGEEAGGTEAVMDSGRWMEKKDATWTSEGGKKGEKNFDQHCSVFAHKQYNIP